MIGAAPLRNSGALAGEGLQPEPTIGVSRSSDSNAATSREELIVQRIRSGESELFYDLVRPHLDGLRKALRSACPNDAATDDVLQQILLLAFSNLQRLRSAGLFRPWLFKIAINEVRKSQRGRSHEHLFSSIDEAFGNDGERALGIREPVDCRETPSEELERKELGALLRKLLKTLPAKSCEALLLHDLENVSFGNIAMKFNITEAEVRSIVCRARFKLRQLLSSTQSAG